jgi:hypothetical protein
MESGLFRQKSVERISSPEDLHEYMRVTSPRLWMILIAILVLLAGFILFASTATMENTMAIQVHAENFPSYVKNEQGEYVEGPPETMMTAMMPISAKDVVETGMAVRIGEVKAKVTMIAVIGGNDTESGQPEVMLDIEPDAKGKTLTDGDYDAVLVVESTTPISFLWAKN